MIPCMGGWCNSRGRCANFYATSETIEPVERLCGEVEEPDKPDKPIRLPEKIKNAVQAVKFKGMKD